MSGQRNQFASKVKTANKRAKKIGAEGRITLGEIVERWSDTIFCAICKRFIEESDASLDHLDPLSQGGRNELDNILIVHSWCNNLKGNQDIQNAYEKFSKTYPTEETGSVVVDSGAMHLVHPWATKKVKRTELPENFANLTHLEQINFVFDLSLLIQSELEIMKKHKEGYFAEKREM